MFRLKDYLIGSSILAVATILMWGLLIKPHDYVWVDDGEMNGRIQTVLPSNTVMGPQTLKALVILGDGSKTILEFPMNAKIQKGALINVYVYHDEVDALKRKYEFAGFETN